MKKLLKFILWVLGVAGLLLLAFLVFIFTKISDFKLDRDEAYQARITKIWPQTFIESPDFATPLAEKTTIQRMAQAYLHNPFLDEGPYLAAYPVAAKSKVPAVVVMPGGGYVIQADKHEGEDVAKWLNSQCIAAFVLSYRQSVHPAPVADALRAVKYLRYHHEQYNINPASLGVMGFSAGGHLAASASNLYHKRFTSLDDAIAKQSGRPDFSVLAYPVISFEDFTHLGSVKSLLGKDASSTEMKRLLSLHKQVTATTPPAFVWSSTVDDVVPYQNSELYIDALKAKGVNGMLKLYPEGEHGSGLAQNEAFANAWPGAMLEWLKAEGFYQADEVSGGCKPI